MTHPLITRLHRCAEFKGRSMLGKLVRRPFWMSWTRLLEFLSRKAIGPRRVQSRTFWGQAMQLVLPDTVSVSLHRYGFFEEGLSSMLLERLKPGMCFFDIGAHFGYFTLLARHLVGVEGQIHSFEPTPRTFGVLQANAAGDANIHLNRNAVHSQHAKLLFTDYGVQYTAFNTLGSGNLAQDVARTVRAQQYDVEAVSIDEYVGRTGARPDFVKIDAEGAETAIIEGMKDTIARHRPLITVEVGDINPDEAPHSRALLELLMGLGYRPASYEPGLRAIVPHRLTDRYDYGNVLLLPKDDEIFSYM